VKTRVFLETLQTLEHRVDRPLAFIFLVRQGVSRSSAAFLQFETVIFLDFGALIGSLVMR
jgi:hypothetical protein